MLSYSILKATPGAWPESKGQRLSACHMYASGQQSGVSKKGDGNTYSMMQKWFDFLQAFNRKLMLNVEKEY